MRNNLLLILASILAFSANVETVLAQTFCVSGTVRISGTPIPNASVKLLSATREIVTFSDLDGSYQLCAEQGDYKIEANSRSDTFHDLISLEENMQKDIDLET